MISPERLSSETPNFNLESQTTDQPARQAQLAFATDGLLDGTVASNLLERCVLTRPPCGIWILSLATMAGTELGTETGGT